MCFVDRICQIFLHLDSHFGADHVHVTLAIACPFSWVSFQLVDFEDVDRMLGMVRATWLIKSAKIGLMEWLRRVINACLKNWHVPSCLEEAVMKSFKKSAFHPDVFIN